MSQEMKRNDDIVIPGGSNLSGKILRDRDGRRIRELQVQILTEAIRQLNEIVRRDVGTIERNTDYELVYKDGVNALLILARAHNEGSNRQGEIIQKKDVSPTVANEIKKVVINTVEKFLFNFTDTYSKDPLPLQDRIGQGGFLNVIKHAPIKWLEDLISMYVNFERKTYIDLANFLILSNDFSLHTIIFGIDLIMRCNARFSSYNVVSATVTNKDGKKNEVHMLGHDHLHTTSRLRGDFRLRLESGSDNRTTNKEIRRREVALIPRVSCRSNESVVGERVVVSNSSGIRMPGEKEVKVTEPEHNVFGNLIPVNRGERLTFGIYWCFICCGMK